MTANDELSTSNDPYARQLEVFPRLAQEMITRVMAYGSEEWIAEGSRVFERGERNVDFFVVLEGELEILSVNRHGYAIVVTTLVERQFTGELDLFNARANLVNGRASVDSNVLRIPRADFRRMIACAGHRRSGLEGTHYAPGRPDSTRAGRRCLDRSKACRRYAPHRALFGAERLSSSPHRYGPARSRR